MNKHNLLHPVTNKFGGHRLPGVLAIAVIVSLVATVSALADAQIQLVSVNRYGTQGGNGGSFDQVISADGRFVAFVSNASDLVSNDTNNLTDIFVRDQQNGITTLVSANRDGTNSGNGPSRLPAISADGRFVAFQSRAGDLVGDDTNGMEDIFIRDLQNGITTLVSVNSAGNNGGNGPSDSYVSLPPAISADGRFVAFASSASDLVSHDANGFQDIFVRDLQNGTTTLVSINLAGTNGGSSNSHSPTISADGRFVAFASLAGDLVSGDQDYGAQDIFVRDLQNGTTTLASVPYLAPLYGNLSFYPVISADGRFVAFVSYGSGLVSNDLNVYIPDVYVRDLRNGTTILVSVNRDGTNGGNNQSFDEAISADGRFVVFRGFASDLVSNDTNGTEDVFMRDLQSGTTTLVSVNRDGTSSGNNYSIDPVISADGRFVAFQSAATNLTSENTNGVFLRDLRNGTTTLVSGNSGQPMISADGRVIAFRQSLDIYAWGSNQRPTAVAGGPYTVNEGSSVTVAASGSDPEGGSLTYAWDLDNDGTFETAGQSVTFSAANLDGSSTYTIKVQLTDDGGLSATDPATVDVLNVAPTANLTIAPAKFVQGGSATLAFSDPFDPGVADAAAGFRYSYDCTNNDSFELAASPLTSFVCAYPAAGDYTALGRVADKDGGFTDYTVQVKVLTPREGTQGLIDQVQALIPGSLNDGQGHALITKLEAIIKQLDLGKVTPALNQLEAFINDVNADIGSGKLTLEEGQPLIDAANAIIAALGG